jgi:hypothetical protein
MKALSERLWSDRRHVLGLGENPAPLRDKEGEVTLSTGLSVAASMIIASGAMATPTFVGHIQFFDSYGSTGGGEFRCEPQADFAFVPLATGTPFQFGNPAGAPKFESFCVEKYEGIDFGVTYDADLNTVTTSSDSHYAGGALGGFNDPLDARTAYLYTHFIQMNLLTPYDYVNEGPRIDDANALQTAIWFIEQEDPTPLFGKALDFYNEANNAVTSGAWTGLGNVRILNIYTNSARVDHQDELVMVPGAFLPSPASLSGLALAGAAMAMRRRREPDR